MGVTASPFTFSDADLGADLDAVLLLKRNGTLLSAWTRKPVELEIVSVMTATLLGSVETIAQAMNWESPASLQLVSEVWQLHAVRLPTQAVLVLIAPATTRSSDVRRAAQRLAAKFRGTTAQTRRGLDEVSAMPTEATQSPELAADGAPRPTAARGTVTRRTALR